MPYLTSEQALSQLEQWSKEDLFVRQEKEKEQIHKDYIQARRFIQSESDSKRQNILNLVRKLNMTRRANNSTLWKTIGSCLHSLCQVHTTFVQQSKVLSTQINQQYNIRFNTNEHTANDTENHVIENTHSSAGKMPVKQGN